jgi:hypothetical protein
VHAWGSPLVLSFLAVGAVLVAGFVWVESRHGKPLIPLPMFRSRALTSANLIMRLIGAVIFALFFFFLSQYLQDVHRYSALRPASRSCMRLTIIIGTQLSSRIVDRVGSRTRLAIGRLISTVGLALLSRPHATSFYPLHIALPGALITFGIGTSFVPVTLSATTGVDRRDAGLAYGLINTTRQGGGSVGLAALLTIAASRAHAGRFRHGRRAERGRHTGRRGLVGTTCRRRRHR